MSTYYYETEITQYPCAFQASNDSQAIRRAAKLVGRLEDVVAVFQEDDEGNYRDVYFREGDEANV